MMYRLKKGIPDFDVVDGKFAGRQYRRGKLYAEVPPEESKKFERVDDPPKQAAPKPEAQKVDPPKQTAPAEVIEKGGKK